MSTLFASCGGIKVNAQPPLEYRTKVHLFGAISSPSCANYVLRKTADDKAQIHKFSDVGQDGYEAVSYLRLKKNNASNVSFLMRKARIASLEQVTIPQLGLTAAVIAVRVDKMLQKIC